MQLSIELDDVLWEMDYTDFNKRFPERAKKSDKEMMFESDKALAILLINDKVFLNSHWWEDSWPEEAKKVTSLNVNCNDIFAWGCADAEEVLYSELQDLYEHYIKDQCWGTDIWCIKKRKYLPQKPVYRDIMKAGVWNLDELAIEFDLEPNWDTKPREEK